MDDKIERAYKIKDLPDWLKERINLKHIENIDKKEYIKKNINLYAELINQSMKISKDQIKYKFVQSNLEFLNEGYLEKGDLIFELMENNKANIIGKIITSKKIELKINLSLKNEFKKNNNI
jgi:disulfide oxidoreductase YuzD